MTVDKPSPAQEANTMVTDEMVEKAERVYWDSSNDPEGARDMRAALEAALSAAEPVGYRWTFDNGVTWHYGKDNPGPFRFGNADEIQPLYAAPPAPSVAVKPLEWEETEFLDEPNKGRGAKATSPHSAWYFVNPHKGGWRIHFGTEGIHPTIEAAKAAAQSHYESRIRSALSAQVQDVAGLPQDVIDLVIAAREFWDIHNDMERESNALDKALEKFAIRVPYEDETRSLPASPAKQEG